MLLALESLLRAEFCVMGLVVGVEGSAFVWLSL